MKRVAKRGSLVGVRSTGVLATVMRAEGMGADTLNLSLRLFAILDLGISVASASNAVTVALNGDEELESVLRVGLRDGAHWRGLVDTLAQHDVQASAETLQTLPFEVVLTQGAREALRSQK